MMTPEDNVTPQKKAYDPPKLTIHGDVEDITLGDALGESLDAAFTTSASANNPRGTKQPRIPISS